MNYGGILAWNDMRILNIITRNYQLSVGYKLFVLFDDWKSKQQWPKPIQNLVNEKVAGKTWFTWFGWGLLVYPHGYINTFPNECTDTATRIFYIIKIYIQSLYLYQNKIIAIYYNSRICTFLFAAFSTWKIYINIFSIVTF